MIDTEVLGELLERMRRIEGQARGIQRMMEQKRDYTEVLMQLAAMREAINRVGIRIIGAQMAACIRAEIMEGRDCRRAVEEAMETFVKFS